MNKLILGVSLVIAVLLSQTAAADSRHGRQGYNDSRYSGNHFRSYSRINSRSHNRDFDRRGNRNYSRAVANPYHYGRVGNRRGNNFVGISYGNSFYNNGFNNRFNNNFNNSFYNNGYRNRWGRNRNRSNSSFVGGLVLGSLLGGQNYSSRSYETVVRERDVVYVNSSARAPVSATPKRRLLRDLQGDCYQIEISQNGDELRSQIDPAACDF